jgi:hypothetical protein
VTKFVTIYILFPFWQFSKIGFFTKKSTLTHWNILFFMQNRTVPLTTGLVLASYRWSAGVLPERYQDPLNAGHDEA